MAEPLNDDVSWAEGNNARSPDQQSARTAVATPHTLDDSNRNLKSLAALNLKSEMTVYMLKKAEAKLCEGRVDCQTGKALGLQKFKATSEPFSVLRIGKYEVRTQYASHLIAKWYYTRKQLNWEILENGLKKKIEISWSDITAMRVEYGEDVEILKIELYKLPHFYCETELRPKKHTSWKPCSDFTEGQACTYRRHHLEFPRGTLGRNMEQLFFLDSRLRELTRRPFPSSQSPFFVDYITDSTQPAPPLINSELIQLHHHLNHQLLPSDDELKILIQQYKRQCTNHQTSSLENSLAAQVSDYGYAPPPLLPRNGTIFSGTEGHDANSNPNLMNVAHPWNNQGVFNQEMGHHPGLASSSNATRMDVPLSSSYYPIANGHAGQEGLIYPELWSNHNHNHQDHQYMVDYNPANFLPNDHMKGQFMGHWPGEQITTPLSYNSDKVTRGASHQPEGYDHNRNPKLMMTSKEPWYMSAGMKVAHQADPWNDQGIFNQDMGRHSGLASSSNGTGMDMPLSSGHYPITNYRTGWGSHEGHISNNELVSNHDRDHQDHQYMADYNTDNFLPCEYMTVDDDDVRMGSCFWGDKPPHFLP